MSKCLMGLVAVLMLFGLESRAHAAVAAGTPFEAVNVEIEDARAATLLFHRAYAAVSGLNVTTLTASGEAPINPSDACQQVGCQLVVTGMMTRLGSRIVIAVSEVDPSGKVIHSTQATAGSMDDLEGVLPRLAEALARRVDYEQTRTPETVTQREVHAPSKMRADTVPALRAGFVGAWMGGAWASSVEGVVDLRFERGSQFINFAIGLILSTSGADEASYAGLFSELGGGIYLSDGDTAPYVAGAVVPRLAGGRRARSTAVPVGGYDPYDDGSDFGVGLGMAGRVGIMFMRSSTTRLMLDLGVVQEMTRLAGVRPTVFRLSAGVAF